MKQKTAAIKFLRTKIAAGYVLILILIFSYVRAVDLSLIGETILGTVVKRIKLYNKLIANVI